MLVWDYIQLYPIWYFYNGNTLDMKNLKELLIKVIDKIDGVFLQLYPELTKHMKKDDE
jgi:hypothetical protein